ncbi:NUDIX hydrolase [Clostridium sp.]|uniref:NUDIX hydrolase n=1 Tax=Clostridium sp. TaxID=1506 RepID=UPI003464383D
MINFKIGDGIFNFRVAGILIKDNSVLIHKLTSDDFYAFPGGRVEINESTENTIIREMEEELQLKVTVDRPLWVSEHFFTNKEDRYHEVCFYYLIKCEDNRIFERGERFNVTEEDREFEFKWVKLKDLKDEVIYPIFIKDRIENLPITIERVVSVEK